MNRNIKRIIALTLIIGVYTIAEPVKYINLANTKVYADVTSIYLDSISMSNGDIDFNSDKLFYDVNVEDTVNEVRIFAKPKSSDSEVKINGSVVDSSDKYRASVHLDMGENVIKIEVSNNDSASKIYTLIVTRGKSNLDDIYLDGISSSAGTINFQKETASYNLNVRADVDKIKIKATPDDHNNIVEIDGERVDEAVNYEKTIKLEKGKNEIIVSVEDKKDKKRSYKLNITRTTSTGAEAQDNVYLDALKVSDTDISLSKSKTVYNVKVNSDIYSTTVKFEPENEKYMVEVNGDAVEASKNYEKIVTLSNNLKTEVKIKVEDLSGKRRIYTVNIYKGEIPKTAEAESNAVNTATTNAASTTAESKANQWVKINDKWQYNDATGNPIKNSWFYDRNYGKSYYLQADGTMVTGWLNNNGKWYYLGADGAMKTGWILDGNKYYYLYSDGSMAANTVVDGYRVDESGAWVK